MATRKTTTRTLRVLRTILLVSLVAFIALVVALYRFGRSGVDTPAVTERAMDDEGTPETRVMAGSGFDYRVTQGEQTLARIRADRVLSEEEDVIVLQGVNPIEIYREDGDLYKVFSDTGTYNLDSQETHLEGNVRIEGPRGLELLSGGLSIGRRAQVVTSDTPVSFKMAGEFVGRSRNLSADLKREIFTLTGRVAVQSISPEREPILLTCRRLSYDRAKQIARTSGNVRFAQGGSHLSAPEMYFHMTEDESNVRFISAPSTVEIYYLRRIGRRIERTLEVTGDELALNLDPVTGKPVEGEIRSRGGRRARLWSTDETSLVRSMVAPVLHALFEDGEISYAEAYGTVFMREYLAFDRDFIFNWACGDRAEVTFTGDGEIEEASFHERVDLRNRQGRVRADRLDMTGSPERKVMRGEPAHIIGVQGELTAPEIVQTGENGPIDATGGVRGLFDQDRGKQTLSVGGGKGPVRLESVTARWNPETEAYRFDDDVRMWQGENLLLADTVVSDPERNFVIARGNVKTILVPEDEEEGEDGEAEAEGPGMEGADPPTEAEEGESMPREPIEVTSEWMEYGVERKVVIYHEKVRITQTGRLMTCDEAEAQLLEGGGVDTLDCRGNARIVDNVAGANGERRQRLLRGRVRRDHLHRPQGHHDGG